MKNITTKKIETNKNLSDDTATDTIDDRGLVDIWMDWYRKATDDLNRRNKESNIK